jgi:hypothetical protein
VGFAHFRGPDASGKQCENKKFLNAINGRVYAELPESIFSKKSRHYGRGFFKACGVARAHLFFFDRFRHIRELAGIVLFVGGV